MAHPSVSLLPTPLLPFLPTVMIKIPTLCFSYRTALVRVMVLPWLLSHAPVFLAFPPPRSSSIVRPGPAVQAGSRGRCPLGYD
jgi:hypothetical protein